MVKCHFDCCSLKTLGCDREADESCTTFYNLPNLCKQRSVEVNKKHSGFTWLCDLVDLWWTCCRVWVMMFLRSITPTRPINSLRSWQESEEEINHICTLQQQGSLVKICVYVRLYLRNTIQLPLLHKFIHINILSRLLVSRSTTTISPKVLSSVPYRRQSSLHPQSSVLCTKLLMIHNGYWASLTFNNKY